MRARPKASRYSCAGEPRGPAQNHPQNFFPPRPQRQPHANLPRPFADQVCHDPEDPDRSYQLFANGQSSYFRSALHVERKVNSNDSRGIFSIKG